MGRKVFKVLALLVTILMFLPSVGLAGDTGSNGQWKNQETLKAAKKTEKSIGNKDQKKTKKVAHIILNKKSITLTVGSTEQLVATIKPPNATDQRILWVTTDEEVAVVDQNGKVTGVKNGTAVIYAMARDGKKSASCTVSVVDENDSSTVPVRSISLNKSNLTLQVGSEEKLTVTVVPSNATNKTVSWESSNSNVATVDQSGNIEAVGEGTAVITVKSLVGNIRDYCTVTVTRTSSAVRVTAVSIDRTTSYIAVKEGTTKSLSVTISPENATDKRVTWKSSNQNVAEVDEDGNVYGRDEGTAVITVTTEDRGKTDSCTVKVISESRWESVRSLSLNLVQTTIPEGFKDTLRYEVEPSDASDKEIRWYSSNTNVATVDFRGEVTAVSPGTAVITAWSVDGDETATCNITVAEEEELPSNGIVLNKLSSIILVGEKDYPVPTIYPSSSIITGLTWSSSNTEVATVNAKGEVTGRKPGTAVITVRTTENKTDSYTVVVI